jgi:hypothetical protein
MEKARLQIHCIYVNNIHDNGHVIKAWYLIKWLCHLLGLSFARASNGMVASQVQFGIGSGRKTY